jgi:hypothetical protein
MGAAKVGVTDPGIKNMFKLCISGIFLIADKCLTKRI